jgi:uncharacterized protein (UPF0335 family)
MVIDQANILAFFESVEAREEEKKEIADDIKKSFEAFACNHEINKKAVAKAYKEWKAYKKDEQEYVALDFEADSLFVKAVPELAPQESN